MDADLIGKFITQQVTTEMAEKTKQYEKNIKIWRKAEKIECQESLKKRYEGRWTRLQEKKINDSDDYKVKNTQEICVSIGTRPKEHPLEPLEGKKPKSRQCQHRYVRKRERKESSALEKRIEVNYADLENRWRQIVQSVQEKVKESYSFLPDER